MFLLKNLILFFILLISFATISQSEKTLLIELEKSSKNDAIKIYNQLSKVTLIKNPKKSLDYAKEAIQLNVNNPKEQSLAYINSGKASASLKRHEKSIEYFEKALIIYKKNKIELGVAYGNLLLGRAYLKLNKKKQAISYLEKSYTINNTAKSNLNAAYAAHDLVEIYGNQKDIKNTQKWSNKAIASYELVNNLKQITKVTFLYGAYLAEYGDYKNAKIQLDKALNQASNNPKLAKQIKQILNTIEHNKTIERETISNHQISQQEEQDEYLVSIEKQTVLTLAEIKKLSKEKQLVELRLKIERDNFEKETLIQRHILEQKNKDIAIKDANIETHKAKIEQQKTEKKNRTLQLIGAIICLVLIAVIAVITFLNFRNKKKAYHSLAIKSQQIITQKEEIEYKSQNIGKSIQYAQKIQLSLLPNEKTVQTIFPNSFVFFQPKDNVSGDFIWTHTEGNKVLIAVADCTGHGVPGAFMSIICANLLEKIVVEEKIISPELILTKIDERLKKSINKYEEHGINDGMDIALIVIEGNQLLFSGARNPLYIVSSGELITLKGDRKSIGYDLTSTKKFTLQYYTLEHEDYFYLSTDGYIDQRGGKDKTKFYAQPFRNLLEQISTQPFSQQKKILENTFNNWKNKEEQVDDVTVLGFKV